MSSITVVYKVLYHKNHSCLLKFHTFHLLPNDSNLQINDKYIDEDLLKY